GSGSVGVEAVRGMAMGSGRYTGELATTVGTQVLVLAPLTTLVLAGVTQPSVWVLGYALSYALPTAACVIRWSRDGAAKDKDDEDGALRTRAVRREGLALLPAAVANMGMLRFDRLM